MTIKVTITHDEPTNERSLHVGVLRDLTGYDVPQMQELQILKPGESVSLHVHDGARIEVWEASLPIELRVADEIEAAMNMSKTVPAPKLEPRVRMKVARAAIAAIRQR